MSVISEREAAESLALFFTPRVIFFESPVLVRSARESIMECSDSRLNFGASCLRLSDSAILTNWD